MWQWQVRQLLGKHCRPWESLRPNRRIQYWIWFQGGDHQEEEVKNDLQTKVTVFRTLFFRLFRIKMVDPMTLVGADRSCPTLRMEPKMETDLNRRPQDDLGRRIQERPQLDIWNQVRYQVQRAK